MKIIGSNTGAYEFIIKLPTGLKFKIGKRKNSDLDLVFSENEIEDKKLFIGTLEDGQSINKIDIFIGEPWGPYIENDKLYLPQSYDYLIFTICNKLFFKNRIEDLIKSYKKTVEIFNHDGKKLGEIILDPEKHPRKSSLFNYIIKRGKEYSNQNF